MNTGRDTYFAAAEEHRRVCDHFRSYVASEGDDIEALKNLQRSVPPGLYEHWKSKEGDPKFYAVLAAGCEQDVYTPLVTFASLYGTHAGKIAFRHLLNEDNGFLKPIDQPQYRGRRFTLTSRLSLPQLSVLIECAGELSCIKEPLQVRRHAAELLCKHKSFLANA